MRHIYGVFLVFCSVIVGAGVVRAESVTTEVARCGLERLYFPVGSEALVYPGCRFVLLRGDSALLEGEIEYSAPGVAVSAEIAGVCDSIEVSGAVATIDTYSIDSTIVLRFGQSIGPWFELLLSEAGDSPAKWTVEPYGWGERASERMVFDVERGVLDGCFSYSEIPSGSDRGHEAMPATWMVVLTPNLDSKVNEQGMLTTALYYAFDPSKLPLMFDGDDMVAVNALSPMLDGGRRPFTVDIVRAQGLLAEALGNRKEITLAITDPSLRTTAMYFADILARERIVTTITTDRTTSDCYLSFAPVDIFNDGYTLSYLLARLTEADTVSPSVYESLSVARSHLDRARLMEADDRLASLALVNNRLVQELGVFPLFRPAVHMLCEPSVSGIDRDQTGRLDLSRGVELRPPTYLSGGGQ